LGRLHMQALRQMSLLPLLLICLFSHPLRADNSITAFMQLVSFNTQLARKPSQLVTFKSVEQGENATDIDHVTISETGTYFILISLETGADQQKSSVTTGFLDAWLERNDKPIDFTVIRTTIRPNELLVVTTQAILKLNKGDKLSIKYASNNRDIGLISIHDNPDTPPISSVNLSLYKL
ncbi:MAG: hypothetical protein B7X00_01655, partial [Legionella sp. 21-45-4]